MQTRIDNRIYFVGIGSKIADTRNFLGYDRRIDDKWIFNTPVVLLVQSIKKAVYIMLKERSPLVETLHSLLLVYEM